MARSRRYNEQYHAPAMFANTARSVGDDETDSAERYEELVRLRRIDALLFGGANESLRDIFRTEGLSSAGLTVDENVARTLTEDRGVCRAREVGDFIVPTNDAVFLREMADLKKFLVRKDRVLSDEQFVGV